MQVDANKVRGGISWQATLVLIKSVQVVGCFILIAVSVAVAWQILQSLPPRDPTEQEIHSWVSKSTTEQVVNELTHQHQGARDSFAAMLDLMTINITIAVSGLVFFGAEYYVRNKIANRAEGQAGG